MSSYGCVCVLWLCVCALCVCALCVRVLSVCVCVLSVCVWGGVRVFVWGCVQVRVWTLVCALVVDDVILGHCHRDETGSMILRPLYQKVNGSRCLHSRMLYHGVKQSICRRMVYYGKRGAREECAKFRLRSNVTWGRGGWETKSERAERGAERTIENKRQTEASRDQERAKTRERHRYT